MVTAPPARRATATRHSSLERLGCAFDDMNLGTPPSVSWVIACLTDARGGSGDAKRAQSARFRSLRVKSAPVFTPEGQTSAQAQPVRRPGFRGGCQPTRYATHRVAPWGQLPAAISSLRPVS